MRSGCSPVGVKTLYKKRSFVFSFETIETKMHDQSETQLSPEVALEKLAQLRPSLDRDLHFKVPTATIEDMAEAAWWFSRAAEAGLTDAQYELALLYSEPDTREDLRERAVYWALVAADKGSINACILLGDLYYKGYGTAKDLKASAENYLIAAKAGNLFCQAITGYNYLTGSGFEKDPVRAYAWLMLASMRGETRAQSHLNAACRQLSAEMLFEAKKLIPTL
jgi:TPR repeat protein